MSALNFANSLAPVFERSITSQNQPNNQPQNTQENTKKMPLKFAHGNNIILTQGTYKGYYGFVYDVRPSSYDVEFYEDQFVPVSQYGSHPVGSNIMTEFGESVVVNHIPQLIAISTKSGELRLPHANLTRVVQYVAPDGLIKLGAFSHVQNPTDGNIAFEIQPYKLDYSVYYERSYIADTLPPKNESVLEFVKLSINKTSEMPAFIRARSDLKQLAEAIKNHSVLTDTPILITNEDILANGDDILLDEMYFVTDEPVASSNTNFLGLYGSMSRFIDEQYIIRYKKTVNLAKSSFTKGTKLRLGSNVSIQRGSFSGKDGVIVSVREPELTVYLDAVGRKVSKHSVRVGDTFIERAIHPRDVFYIDLRLKDGNFFQVTKLNDDSIEGTMKSKDYHPMKINWDAVESTQPGFKIYSTETLNVTDVELKDNVFVHDNTENTSNTEELDDIEDTDNPEITDDIEPEVTIEDPQDQVYTASYKALQETIQKHNPPSKHELRIKSHIDTILKHFGGYDINVFNVIKQVIQAEMSIKQLIKNSLEIDSSFWKSSDEKFITACLVLYEIIRTGYNNTMVGDYIRLLIESKYFNKKDISESIFSNNGWTDLFKVDKQFLKNLQNENQVFSVLRLLFDNCNAVMQKWFGPVILDSDFTVQLSDFIPLGGVRKLEVPRVMISIREFIKNDYPDSANKILFGPAYANIIDLYKTKLMELVNKDTNNTTKTVYTYILENLERAPFALKDLKRQLEKNKLDIDKKKYKKLSQVWNTMFTEIQAKYQEDISIKKQNIKTHDKNMQAMSKKRKAVFEDNVMFGKFGDLDILDDSDEEYEPEFPIKETSREKVQKLQSLMQKLTFQSRKKHQQRKRNEIKQSGLDITISGDNPDEYLDVSEEIAVKVINEFIINNKGNLNATVSTSMISISNNTKYSEMSVTGNKDSIKSITNNLVKSDFAEYKEIKPIRR
jgi:ribosomal protein L24